MSRRIDATELIAHAEVQNDLTFQDRGFVEPLENLVQSLDDEAQLTDEAINELHQDFTRLLGNRIQIENAAELHPEILEEDVSDPIIITGLARTGSTKLQRVMGSAPHYQAIPLWRNIFPVPLAPAGTEPDPRIAMVEELETQMTTSFPEVMAGHALRTHEPEEETLLLPMSFRTPAYSWWYRAPSFLDWTEHNDQRPTYTDLRRTLQYLQWEQGGRKGGPWVLKSPIHLGALDLVFNTFPNAIIVHCHRDIQDALPSLARLLEVMRFSRGARSVDLQELGRFSVSYCSLLWQRNIEQRDQLGEQRILDVSYEDIRDDLGSVLDSIHHYRGVALDPENRNLMLSWESANPQHQFGRHVYSQERFGMTAGQIDAAFGPYIERFAALGRGACRGTA